MRSSHGWAGRWLFWVVFAAVLSWGVLLALIAGGLYVVSILTAGLGWH